MYDIAFILLLVSRKSDTWTVAAYNTRTVTVQGVPRGFISCYITCVNKGKLSSSVSLKKKLIIIIPVVLKITIIN